MGLSRNKVAVSEGAAGSPPFYGERAGAEEATAYSEKRKTKIRTHEGLDEIIEEIKDLCCSIFSDEELLRSQCYKRRGSTRSHSEHGS